MFEEIKKFLNFPFELNIPEVKFDCIWSEILKLPRVLTKKVILINKYLARETKNDCDGFRTEGGIGIITETQGLATFFYFLMQDTPKNQVIFAEYVKQFIDSHQKEIIGIDEMTLEKMVVNLLHQKRLLISCAESCTGGMLISRIISVPGASLVTEESYVTYSDPTKAKILGIKPKFLKEYGTVSGEAAGKMAEMVRAIASSDVGIGVTGYTTGDTKAPEDGFFYYAISYRDTLLVDKDQVEGTRDEMRFDQTTIILWRLLNLLRS